MNATLNVMIVCLAFAAQAVAAVPEDAPGKEIFHNDRVNVELQEIPSQQEAPLRHYEKDTVTVFVSGGHVTMTIRGRPPAAENVQAGQVQFRTAGFGRGIRNNDADTFRSVIVELNERQGQAISEQVPVRRYCSEASRTACVEETHLFCTLKLCVNDVKMGPQATRNGFASDADQMLVALSDYKLTAIGAVNPATATHARQSGQVEWIPAGAPSRWTNESTATMRFVLIRAARRRQPRYDAANSFAGRTPVRHQNICCTQKC